VSTCLSSSHGSAANSFCSGAATYLSFCAWLIWLGRGLSSSNSSKETRRTTFIEGYCRCESSLRTYYDGIGSLVEGYANAPERTEWCSLFRQGRCPPTKARTVSVCKHLLKSWSIRKDLLWEYGQIEV
jgi:hypothetical protein